MQNSFKVKRFTLKDFLKNGFAVNSFAVKCEPVHPERCPRYDRQIFVH